MQVYNKYIYVGPVMSFDTLLEDRWMAETVASSENKARSNLAYQYKKKHNKTPDVKITLPGKLEIVE